MEKEKEGGDNNATKMKFTNGKRTILEYKQTQVQEETTENGRL